MKKIGSKGMKTLKTLHLIFIMLWTVGVIAMAALQLMDSQSGDELYMKFKAIRFIDDLLVVPSAIITVLIGIIYGVKTNWGFFKYRWITVKWIISIIIIVVGTFVLSPMLDANLEAINELRAGAFNNSEVESRSHVVLISGICSSLVLIFLIVISVFKPWKSSKTNKKCHNTTNDMQ